jgi:hypothetical protein
MLFLDGVYVERPDGSVWFRCVKAPNSHNWPTYRPRFLERQGLLERDVENSYLAVEAGADGSAVGPLDHVPHRRGRAQSVHIGGSGIAGQGCRRHGGRRQAYMDVFTASPGMR